MAIHKLTPRKVANAKTGKHEDGGGLRLVVSKNGARSWVLRYTIDSKRREMGLGSFPALGLAAAREQAIECRAQAAAGIDPIHMRKVEEEKIPTFTACAARYIRAHRRGWSNVKHRHQWCATLKTYARPIIGTKRVDTITTEDVLEILKGIWTTKTETAKRLQGRIENVLDFAAAHKWRDHMNPARWRGHLSMLLPKPSKVATVKHHPAMPYTEVPAFMAELAQSGGASARALRLLILTATRSSEVLQAQWPEFDLDGATWTIPAQRTKMKKEHRIPISGPAMAIIQAQERIIGNPYVFAGARYGRPLSFMAMLKTMRDRGFGVHGERGDYVPHGFRSAFRDWAADKTNFSRSVCEQSLAHSLGSSVEQAYRRSDLFDKRRKLMAAWARFIDRKSATVVVPIRA